MAQASSSPLYCLFGDRLLEFPCSSRRPRHCLFDRTFSGAALALGPLGQVYITGGLVNGHDSKAIYQWNEELTVIGDMLYVRNHHSAVCYQGDIYLVGGGLPLERFCLGSRTSKVVDAGSVYATCVCIHRDELVIFGRRSESDKHTQLHIYSFTQQKSRPVSLPKGTKALSQAICFSLDLRSVVLCGGFIEGQANAGTIVYDSLQGKLEQVRFEVDLEGYREPVRVHKDCLVAIDVAGLRHVVGLQGLKWELKKDIYGPEHWASRACALFAVHYMRQRAHKWTVRLPWQLLVEAVQML